MDRELLTNIPDPGNKIVVLLNLPENMSGIPMIGSEKESEYKLMHNLLLPDKQLNNTIYDVLSYNMTTPGDGRTLLLQMIASFMLPSISWGTCVWYEGKGGYSYENEDYKVKLIDPGHWYELTLKKPADRYLLLYQNRQP